MKNKILSIFVLLMFMVCNIVYASGEAFYDVEFKYSDNGIMTVSGKLSEGEDRLIYIDVTDNSGESVYTDMTYSAYDGKFVFVMDVEEWEKGEYLFSFCDEGANRYSVSMTNPFKESDSDVGYDILNNEIWFEDEYEPDKTKNIIEIDFDDAEFMQGKVNEEFYSTYASFIPDYFDASPWARDYVNKGVMIGAVRSLEYPVDIDNPNTAKRTDVAKFRPKEFMKRDEAAEVIFNVTNAISVTNKYEEEE